MLNNNKSKLKIFGISIFQFVIILYVIIQFFPFLWIFFSSFKTSGQITADPWSFPKTLYLDNYNFNNLKEAGINFGIYYKNSIVVTILALLIVLTVSLLASYAIAKLRVPFKNILLIILIGVIAVPIHSLMIPIYYLYAKFKLLSNIYAVALPYAAVNVPFTIVMLQAYFKEFPNELIESAKIDGCSNISAFFRVVFPVSLGSITTVLIINFMRIWNEFLLGLVLLKQDSSRTLPLGMIVFKGDYAIDYGPLVAAIFLTILPTILMFSFFSKYFIGGQTEGAIKG